MKQMFKQTYKVNGNYIGGEVEDRVFILKRIFRTELFSARLTFLKEEDIDGLIKELEKLKSKL
jgi:hypothetical protein